MLILKAIRFCRELSLLAYAAALSVAEILALIYIATHEFHSLGSTVLYLAAFLSVYQVAILIAGLPILLIGTLCDLLEARVTGAPLYVVRTYYDRFVSLKVREEAQHWVKSPAAQNSLRFFDYLPKPGQTSLPRKI